MAEPKDPAAFEPFVPPGESPQELTLAPIVMGTLLGIVFGASSVYLVLKVGLTVSASIPVAVLAFALFKTLSSVFGLRQRTILENNIVQTAGSAGESIAFAVGFVMPALLLLGFDIDVIRVMTVGVLGSLLGILLMIPLRRAFIVKKHGELKYPEGTACADVLIAGEKGGSTARLLFAGFGIGFIYTGMSKVAKLWKEETDTPLDDAGLKGGAIGGEWTTPLLGVGYIIGPRIASIMVAGGVLAYLVITPLIVYFGESLSEPLLPAKSAIDPETKLDAGLIKNMDADAIRKNYILYIGAGAVAAGGIISMIQALPVIVGAVLGAFRDLFGKKDTKLSQTLTPRTERDLPMSFVLFGSIGLMVALIAVPSLGLASTMVTAVAGSIMILLFGLLFVTVSARLTGEIGSSSNPISGMTVATLLLTCLVIVGLNQAGLIPLSKEVKLLALTIAGVVCVACSNGGTTAQALKTGHLVGATPLYQQYAIIIGSLTSALVVGVVLLIMNGAGTVYSKKNLPAARIDIAKLTTMDGVSRGPFAGDTNKYRVLNLGNSERIDPTWVIAGDAATINPGRYFIDDDGRFAYLVDPAVNGMLKTEDDGTPVDKFKAPKTQLVALIINGIFDKNLPWGLVIIGVLIAITLELTGVPSLPFAVGVYLPLASSVPIFVGGAIRFLADKIRGPRGEDGDSSPGVLLSSGFIAGGSIMAVVYAFLQFVPSIPKSLNFSAAMGEFAKSDAVAVGAFGVLCLILLVVGSERFSSSAKPTAK